MVTTHRISTEWDEDNFTLIALHCNLSDYAMAYHMNRAVHLKLERRREDMEDTVPVFPVFQWEDSVNDCHWSLVQNIVKKEYKVEDAGLFEENITIKNHYFIEDHKEVDYFLKIESEQDQNAIVENTIVACNSIQKVITAYQIDADKLTTKENLIFL